MGDKNYPIDILIGADIAAKFMTGEKINMQNVLTAVGTYLGWTVMGKVLVDNNRVNSRLITISIMIHEANISDLWSLDVLGIKDPVEKRDKQNYENLVKENFLNCFL